MSAQIQIGDILQIKANTRLVYLGSGRAAVEMLMEKSLDKQTGERIIGGGGTYWEKTQEVDVPEAKQAQWLALKAKES